MSVVHDIATVIYYNPITVGVMLFVIVFMVFVVVMLGRRSDG
jgi:hypothetical protein